MVGVAGQNDTERPKPLGGRVALAYAAMVGAGVLLFLLIRHWGQGLTAPMPEAGAAIGRAAARAQPNTLAQILLGLVVILIASRAVGVLFRSFGQPPVIGEVLAGILLGPSLLGRIAPATMASIFPPSATPVLGVVAQVGVLLFMFLVGVELNTDRLRERTYITLAISHASIVCPFLLGAALALTLYPLFSSRDVPFTAFALFLGVSMSVTAFPVLARILTDRKLQRTRMGAIAMTCAAVDDVTAWCLLAFVVGVVHARLGGAALTAILTLCYIAGMFVLVRPLLRRLVARHDSREGLSQSTLAMICAALLLSCLTTETIGIHAVFGAFLLGAVIPHDSATARALIDKLEDFVVVLLLPAFFAFTGLRTQIGLIGGTQWLFCALIILVASTGKFGGSVIAGRMTGLPWRDAAALGILMNTRGLMELIVLNVGLDLKVISPRLFAMLVIMAVVTTFMTTPILDRLVHGRWHDEGDDTSNNSLS
jgi:Kef-type K+ transport system membrane component KefB